MKSYWTITRDELIPAMEMLDLVPNRPGIASSGFFQLTPLEQGVRFTLASDVTGYANLKGSGQWPFEDNFYLDRRVFLPFIFASKHISSKSPFMFRSYGRELICVHGRRKARFMGQAKIGGYAQLPSAKLISKVKLSDKARQLIYCARECGTSDPITPAYNCVYIRPRQHTVEIYATNTTVVYFARTENKLDSPAIPFPLFLVSLLGSDQIKSIRWHDRYASLTFPQGVIWQSVNAKAKLFPVKPLSEDIARANELPELMRVDCHKFARVVARLAEYLGSVRRQDWVLILSAKEDSNELVLSSTVPQSVFRERLNLTVAPEQSFEIHWPLEMVLPIFEFLDKRERGTISVRMDKRGASYILATDLSIIIARRKDK